ncbi:MAG: hypothetical protein ABJB98_06415 [Actinomycetota bacterium]
MIIDCDTCRVRGTGCADCVVSVLLGTPADPLDLDESEQHAVDALAECGLVPPLRLVVRARDGMNRTGSGGERARIA